MNQRNGLCHVVSDGRRGIENQALGLAEAVMRRIPLTIEVRHVPRPTWRDVLARLLGRPVAPRSDEHNTAPALWIGAGRAALYQARRDRLRYPDAFFVYVQDPGPMADLFDLVIAPEHDGVTGDNVVSTLGSTNRITRERLNEEKARFSEHIARLPEPRIAVLIGGPSKRHRFDRPTIGRIREALSGLREAGASLMITASRRSPPAVHTMLKELRDEPDVWLWEGDSAGDNPYFAFLAAADSILVTADSTNMLTEAVSAGKPVMMLEVGGSDGKFADLHDALVARGYGCWFMGDVESWPVEPLRETDRAAEILVPRFLAREKKRGA